MVDYPPNKFFNPLKDASLELIDAIDKTGGEDFDVLAVWGDPVTGELYYGESSGCNCCQGPFPGIRSRTDLVQVHSLADFSEYIRTWASRTYGYADMARLYTKAGAMVIRVRNFAEARGVQADTDDLEIEPDLVENDQN